MLEQFKGMFGQHVGNLLKTPYEAFVDRGNFPPARIKIFTEPTGSIKGLGEKYADVGKGFVIGQEEQFSGALAWVGVHISRLIGRK